MEASTMLIHEREHGLYDSYDHMHEFLLVFHRAYSVCIHETYANQQGENVRVPFYGSMRKIDKTGKNMVSKFVHQHAV